MVNMLFQAILWRKSFAIGYDKYVTSSKFPAQIAFRMIIVNMVVKVTL